MMKHVCRIAWLAVVVLLVGAAYGAEQPKRGALNAVMVEKGPALDGTMKDAVWAQCPEMPMGSCTGEEDLQKYKTWGRVLFSPTHVYVGVYCEEPDTDGLKMDITERDGNVWQDDEVEIFLQADPEKPYYQFAVNPRGTLFDSRIKQASWDSTAEVKASVEKGKAWIVTFRVPMSEIGAYVGDDETWTMNLNRSRPARGDDALLEYSWAVMTSTSYHSPSEFGTVKAVKVPKRDDGVTRVREGEAPKPKLANKGTEAGGVTVYYKMMFDQTAEGWDTSSGGVLNMTDDGASGKALHVRAEEKWSGAQLALDIAGSRDLRMAFLMKGNKFPAASLNLYDTVAGDNTTSYGHRYLAAGRWTPVLYYVDRFRYNGKAEGVVDARTQYNGVRFYGPSDPVKGAEFTLDNFVLYRGADKQPPEKVAGLKAEPTAAGVKLSWTAANDNVAPMLYVISRAEGDGAFTKIAEDCTTSYTDATAGKAAYRYRVFAMDFEENFGPWSDAVAVTSASDGKAAELSREEKDRLDFAAHVKEVHAKGVGKVRKLHATLFGDSLTGATVYPQCAQSAFLNMTVNAFGFPSMRTDFGKNNVARIRQQDNPEVMFVLFGTNNSKAANAIPPAMEDLAAIVKDCEDNGTVAVLGTIPPRGFNDAESKPEANYDKSVIELCRKLHIPTGYLFEDIQAAGDRKVYISNDGVHWQGEGMEVGARAWAKALAQIRFVLRDQP